MGAVPTKHVRILFKQLIVPGTDQASDFSITSSFTKASRHCWRETLDDRVGIGSVKYINVLYVVDVYITMSIQDLDTTK